VKSIIYMNDALIWNNIHSISRVTGLAQCPLPEIDIYLNNAQFDKVHETTVHIPGPALDPTGNSSGSESGEIMVELTVEAMGSVATAVAIAERHGSSIPALTRGWR
jgi:hypothetical protein